MSNLNIHAQFELEKAGLFDKDADYGGAHAKAVMDLITVFSEQGHSGMSAAIIVSLFEKLARFQPLTPITSNPDEWTHVADEEDGSLYQNKRRSSTFSNDGGKTWYDIEDRSRDNGATWHGWALKEDSEVGDA